MLSDNIRNYRKENNLSQDELAEKLGVSRQSISLWENGQTQPTIDNIIALAKIFNITADELLESYEGARISQEAPVAPKKRNGSRVTAACLSPPFRSSQTAYCYTYGLLYAGATYPCRANPWHVVTHGTCEFRRLVQFILVGAVYHNALTSCAARLCRACVE